MELVDIILIITSFSTACLSYFILNKKNNIENIIFSLFILCVSLWSWGILFFRISTSINIALLFSSFNYIIALMIGIFFLFFSYLFPNNRKIGLVKIIIICMPVFILIFILTIEPNFLLKNIEITAGIKVANINLLNYLIYSFCFITYILVSYINLFKSFVTTKNNVIRLQLKLIFIGTIIPYIIAIFFDLILPIKNYTYVWVGPLLGLVVTSVITYAIYKHKLLNAKVITTEFFTISLWIFILIKILISNSNEEKIGNIILLIVSIILGILLIRAFILESRQKELLRHLNDTLEEKVDEQTAEIKKAYESEKKARRELEKLNETKDQFIMMTQHHLRSPINNIRIELEKNNNDSFEKINSLIIRLGRIVDDFLNISTLKVGSRILNISNSRIDEIVKDILVELELDIKTMNINLKYPKEKENWPEVMIDSSKIREALLIIIENAIKYNKKDGNIEIITNIKYDTFEIIVQNTGVGITYEEKNKLFTKLFYRGDRAKKQNPIGMGIGLSVARAIAKAHHGDIDINSKGENEGAQVIFSLPINFLKGLDFSL